jgi:hypothetical protein
MLKTHKAPVIIHAIPGSFMGSMITNIHSDTIIIIIINLFINTSTEKEQPELLLLCNCIYYNEKEDLTSTLAIRFFQDVHVKIHSKAMSFVDGIIQEDPQV